MEQAGLLLAALRRTFWGFFGAIWVLVGLLFMLIGVAGGHWGQGLLGVLIAGIGVVPLVKGLRRGRLEMRLMAEGVPADATVTAVERTNVRFNRVYQWIVRYRYADGSGRTHEGTSGHMDPADAEAWHVGDTARVKYDRQNPTDSMWMGAE